MGGKVQAPAAEGTPSTSLRGTAATANSGASTCTDTPSPTTKWSTTYLDWGRTAREADELLRESKGGLAEWSERGADDKAEMH